MGQVTSRWVKLQAGGSSYKPVGEAVRRNSMIELWHVRTALPLGRLLGRGGRVGVDEWDVGMKGWQCGSGRVGHLYEGRQGGSGRVGRLDEGVGRVGVDDWGRRRFVMQAHAPTATGRPTRTELVSYAGQCS